MDIAQTTHSVKNLYVKKSLAKRGLEPDLSHAGRVLYQLNYLAPWLWKRIDHLLMSAGFLQKEKEVACNKTAMQILRFYFVGQIITISLWFQRY